MTKQEYDLLYGNNNLITVNDLRNKEDRILIHGYTLERDTFIIELNNGKFIKIIEQYNKKPVFLSIETNYDFIPDKRVYPKSSDFEFCKLLISRGIDIPFTSF